MDKEKEKGLEKTEKNRGTTMQTVLGIVGIIILIACIIVGYNIMSIKSVIPSNAVNIVPGEFYTSLGIFVIGVGFFAGLSLLGIAYLIHNKPMKKDLND